MFGTVYITIHNGGVKPYAYSEDDYQLHGNNDNANYGPGFSDNSLVTFLGAGTLPRGATVAVAGDVSVVVPVARQGYTLQWTYDMTKPYSVVPINK